MKSLCLFGIAVLAAVGCASPTVGESEGRSSARQVAGRQVSEEELAGVLRGVGFDEATVPKMICTARYESSLHEGATNSNTNGTTDYGIFQINSIHVGKTAGCPSTTAELMDVTANTQCAFGVYSIQGLDAWVAYKSHRAECDAATAPARTADPNADPNGAPSTDPNAADGGAGTGCDPYSDPSCDPGIDPNDPNGGWGDDPCADPSTPGCQGDDPYGDRGGWSSERAARPMRRLDARRPGMRAR